MSDEPTLKTKTDVLDLVIGFMVEHEKRMDQMVGRLGRIAERLSRNSNRIYGAHEPKEPPTRQSALFTLTINNPGDYEKLKSIKIEWETGQREFNPELSEIDAILDQIEHTFKKADHF